MGAKTLYYGWFAATTTLLLDEDADAMHFFGRMDALEVMHEASVSQARDAPIHHDAGAIGAARHNMGFVNRTGEDVALELEYSDMGAIEPARTMTNDALFH